MDSVEFSFVSPVYKGEIFLEDLVKRCHQVASENFGSYEIILVEDHGPDSSWERISKLCKSHPFVKGVKLSRNFGQQYALQAGLDESRGEYVVTLDCDLQDRPEEVVKLLEKAKEGYDIVSASRKSRKDGVVKRFLSFCFYRVLGYLTETSLDQTVANFVLYRRNVVNAMASVHDHRRYYPMLPHLVGFKYAKVEVAHDARPDGNSSYSIRKRFQLALETILNFSDKPLRLTVKLGVVLSLVSILAAVAMVVLYFLGDLVVEGWASLALLISFLSGSIISVLGMVGLYVGQIFEAVKHRPTYIVEQKLNC